MKAPDTSTLTMTLMKWYLRTSQAVELLENHSLQWQK